MTSTIKEPNSLEYLPTLVHRIKALVIDTLLILLIFTLTSLTIGDIGGIAVYFKVAVLIFCFLVYEPLLVSIRGATVGHSIMGLRIKNIQDRRKNIHFIYAVIRLFFKLLLGWISLITVLTNKNKRAVHDMLSGAIVLKN